MVVLYDVTEETGGLGVVPNTNTDEVQQHLRAKYPEETCFPGDWVRLSPKDPYQGKEKLVLAKAGDLILWDSRTIHGGLLGCGYTEDNCPLSPGDLARLSFTVTMTPKSLVKDPKILFKRR